MGTYEPLLKFLTKEIAQGMTEENIALAKQSIIDCVAAIVTGVTVDPLKDILEIPLKGDGNATILGYGNGYSLTDAALYNGFASHILDLDDTSPLMMGHPTVLVLPAVLAVGEALNSSGEEIIKAYLAGVEVACQLANCFVDKIHAAGWHATGVLGSISAACACGVLMSFTAEQFRHAIGAAASLSCGLRANFGTPTKPLHVGIACQNGVLVAQMVQHGLTSSIHALDGEEGFIRLFTGESYEEAKTEKLAAVLGRPYAISDPGFTLKAYPSCSSNHRALGAMTKLLENHPVAAEDVVKIESHMSISALRELVTPDPKTGVEARFSPGFHFALAILGIPIAPAAFCQEMVMDPKVQRLIKATELIHEPELDGIPNMGTGPAYVKVFLKDGTIYREDCWYPLGHKKNPFTEKQLWEKFSSCCEPVIGAEKTLALYQALGNLEKEKSIKAIAGMTL